MPFQRLGARINLLLYLDCGFKGKFLKLHSLKLTAKAPENGWLGDYFPFVIRPVFRGKLAVSFREGEWVGRSDQSCWYNLNFSWEENDTVTLL